MRLTSRPTLLKSAIRYGVLILAVSLNYCAEAQTFSVLYNFLGPSLDGNNPQSGVVFDQQGNLYGTTTYGGDGGCQFGCGTVYQLTPQGNGQWREHVIQRFQGTNGSAPYAPVTLDSSGNVYGVTSACTLDQCNGTAFELMPGANGTWTESTLYSFENPQAGSTPLGGLLLNDGVLYGTSSTAGGYGFGNVFSLSGAGLSTFTVLHDFNALATVDGNGPPTYETLVSDAAGNLYGTTKPANDHATATVFELTQDPQSGKWIDIVLYRFSGSIYRGTVPTGLSIDGSGNLYGAAYSGGPNGNGVVYELSPDGRGNWSFQLLYAFMNSPDGVNPFSTPVFDAAGNLYGTTANGGTSNEGTVYKLSPNGDGTWSETILHNFSDIQTGANPQTQKLTLDASGNIYGTVGGGTHRAGLVYEITPSNNR